MPNVIGMDLQGAQDAIQSVSGGQVWFSSSTDLTGQDRAQLRRSQLAGVQLDAGAWGHLHGEHQDRLRRGAD